MTRNQAIEIARQRALNARESHGYLPVTEADAQTWMPHEWVIDAILWATMQCDLAAQQAEPSQTIYCAEKRKPGGCQLHNLHCGWPKCNEPPKKQAAQPVAWDWLRGVMDGIPTREEFIGGQREKYVAKEAVMGWIEEGQSRAKRAAAQPVAHPTHTSSPQVGPPGHCTLAQVWDVDGNSLATFDSTQNPDVASSRARLLADALNAAAQPQQAADVVLTDADMSDIARDAQIAYFMDKYSSFVMAYARSVEAAVLKKIGGAA